MNTTGITTGSQSLPSATPLAEILRSRSKQAYPNCSRGIARMGAVVPSIVLSESTFFRRSDVFAPGCSIVVGTGSGTLSSTS